MSAVIFDVGANFGKTFMNHARQGNHVYAFEPTPHLISEIKKWCFDIPTYHLIEMAVSDVEGVMDFNVAGQADWGCSSLYQFSDDLKEKWGWRTDFKVTETIKVDVIRLDTFILKNNISKIDYLHVDTQGNDLKVMKSLGAEIGRVKSGVIEVSNLVSLYKNTPTKEECLNFLEETGFAIERIEDSDGMNYEQNVYFTRK